MFSNVPSQVAQANLSELARTRSIDDFPAFHSRGGKSREVGTPDQGL
jgi:hypothetical protein